MKNTWLDGRIRKYFSTQTLVIRLLVFFVTLVITAPIASAAPRSLALNGAVLVVEGSYVESFSVADSVSGTYVYDTDEANASIANTTPSAVPGHEYTSFYEFLVSPYGGSLDFPQVPSSFAAGTLGVVVTDNVALTSDETGGLVPDGTYDLLELNAADTGELCFEPGANCLPGETRPAGGQEWTLVFIAHRVGSATEA